MLTWSCTHEGDRVDTSKTGDSILTDIVANIAHSRLVLADVSVVDEGRFTEHLIRNANVMYEVGVALACRMPSEVLLIRDDRKPCLFDVSSIPHATIDFSDHASAITLLREQLEARIRETQLLHDARIEMAAGRLTQDEIRVLRDFSQLTPDQARDIASPVLGGLSMPNERGISGLLQKGCLKTLAINAKQGSVFYSVTPFGYTLARAVEQGLRKVDVPDQPAASREP